jgi:D-alanyl-D-alanine carboxypeptidase
MLKLQGMIVTAKDLMMRLRIVWLLILLCLGTTVHAQIDVEDELRAFVEGIVPANGSAVSARITIGDDTWAAAAGLVDIKDDEPASPDSRFRIASMSKTFVAVTVLQLVEEGVLDLDDTVIDWLDEDLVEDLANADEATLLQLLTMTAGIPEYLNDDFFEAILEDPTYKWTASEVLRYAYYYDAYFDPGDGFEYINTNYILLQLVIEAATEQPLHEVVRERILDPLELADTYTQIQETLPGDFVHGYEDIEGDSALEDVTEYNDGAGLGDGALISTTADLTRFYQALFIDGELLSEESVEMMIDVANEEYEYGIGLEVYDSEYGLVLGHTGGVLGFTGAVFYAPDLGAIVVILYGSDGLSEDDITTLFEIAEEAA